MWLSVPELELFESAKDVALSRTFFFKTKRKRDLDNQNQLVLDALSGIAYDG